MTELVAQIKRLALLTYVTVSFPDGIRRDLLLAAFWPEQTETRARNALRQALVVLRRRLGEDALPSPRSEIVRVDPTKVRCDATEFEQALASGDLTGALALYRGDFLAGVHLSGVPEIERWIEERRVQFRRRAVRAALTLAEQPGSGQSDWSAVSWAHRAVTLAPHDEVAWRKLIELHIRQGNVPEALNAYDRLARLLEQEFDSRPSPETEHLVAALRSGA